MVDFLGLWIGVLVTAGTEAFEGLWAEEGFAGGAHGGFGLCEGFLFDVHSEIFYLFITGMSCDFLYLYSLDNLW